MIGQLADPGPTKKYRVKLQCRECGHTYKRVLRSLNAKDPPCPVCKKSMINPRDGLADIIKHQKAPPMHGSNAVKAIDYTANLVMEEHKLTDLRDNVRQGETMAPKLAPKLQAQADSFFGPKKKSANMPFDVNRLGKQALSGAFRGGGPDPMKAIQPKYTPNIHVLNEKTR